MKKILLIMYLAVMSVFAAFARDNVSLVEGSLEPLMESSATVCAVIDFSKTTGPNDSKFYDYLDRAGITRTNFAEIQDKCYDAFFKKWQSSTKGAIIVRGKENARFVLTVKVKTLMVADGFSKDCNKITGTVRINDAKTGTLVAVINFNDHYAMKMGLKLNGKATIPNLFSDLSSEICKMVANRLSVTKAK